MTIYQQKVELVLAAWPKTKITELVTRLILNCHGTAFQKLQLHQTELLAENDEKSVKKIIKILGGQWGKISLEQQYQDAEAALFQTQQKADETNSYLARSDVQWMKLLAQKLRLEDLQAYAVLRGSQLSPEDKKKVVLESDSSLDGKLTMNRVSEAIRLLGASFFQDMTGGKRSARTKVYDPSSALLAETVEGEVNETFAANHEDLEEDFIEGLIQEGDEDATLVADFEQAASETLQEDMALAEAYNAYQDARRRLSEKFRNRGFWPTSKSNYNSGKGKGGKFQNKGKGKSQPFGNRPRRSLQDRIMNSTCRICERQGHWKAECPYRNSGPPSQTQSTAASQAPTTTVVMEAQSGIQDPLPMEFMNLPEHKTLDEEDSAEANFESHSMIFHEKGHADVYHTGIQHESWGYKHHHVGPGHERLRRRITRNEGHTKTNSPVRYSNRVRLSLHETIRPKSPKRIRPEPTRLTTDHSQVVKFTVITVPRTLQNPQDQVDVVCFATYGSMGVLDLGASKTVIGSDFVPDLIDSLCPANRQQLTRGECKVTFRFGNQGTLQSQQAIIIPIGSLLLKIAVVPGGTPFLLSNLLMRAMSAQIDCERHQLTSPMLSEPIKLKLTNRGLFLIDLDELATRARRRTTNTTTQSAPTETFVSECREETVAPAAAENTTMQTIMQTDCTIANIPNSEFPEVMNNPTEAHACTESSPATVTSSDLPPEDPKSSLSDVAAGTSSSHASADSSESHRSGSPDPCRLGHGHHRLRIQAQGEVVSGSLVGRPRVGHVHGHPLSSQPEAISSTISSLRGTVSGGAREAPNASAGVDQSRPQVLQAESGCSQDQSQGQSIDRQTILKSAQRSPGISSVPPRCGHPGGLRGRLGSTRDVIPSDYELRPTSPRPIADHERSHDDAGECLGTSHAVYRDPSPEDPAAGQRAVSDLIDLQADIHTATHTDRRKLNQLIVQISHELESQVSQQNSIGPRWVLGEVFCSDQSPLTQQVQNLGSKSFRFGLADGDLSTTEGRNKLFRKIALHRPKSIWFSPVCGPWSSWSNLNAACSLEQWDEHQKRRQQHLYQVALGIVLYRHQISHGDHFHWEQPGRSLMFKIPGMSEVQVHTQTCEFDMCRAGDLRDPVSRQPIKKAMEIMTTSKTMFNSLHGLTCNRQHTHQPIEGSVHTESGTIRRSTFTEVYPRKFARSIAKILHCIQFEKPFHWNAKIHVSQFRTDPVYAARTGTVPYRDRFPKSELIQPLPEDDPRLKRRRLNGKQNIEASQELCQDIIRRAMQEVPRVGKRVIQDPQTRQLLQQIFPDKILISAIGCRGTDRTLGPPKNISPKEAPYRRTIMEIRHTGEVKYEAHWEKWDQLSQRQLVRPAHQCKLNVTVFCRDRTVPRQVSHQDTPMASPPTEGSEVLPENSATSSPRDSF